VNTARSLSARRRQARSSPVVAGLAFSVLGAIAYGFLDITGKIAYRNGLSVPTLLSIRFLGAGACVLVLARATGRRPLADRVVVGRCLAIGLVLYAAESFLLNSSIARMPVAAVILIFYAYPSLVAVLALVLNREGLTGAKAGALMLSAVGVALLLGFPTHGMNAPGIALAFGAATAFAVYAIIAERAIKDVDGLVFSGLVLFGAGVSISVLGAAAGAIHLGQAGAALGWILLHTLLIATGVAAFVAAVTHIGATRAAIGNTLEPALTVLLATVFLHERPGVLQLLGGALLLAAMSLLPRATRTRELAADVPVHDQEAIHGF
jgi:drug/metabolite transporter (DMT)-like permease